MFHTVVEASTNDRDIDRIELTLSCPRYLLQTFRGNSDKEIADVPETLPSSYNDNRHIKGNENT